MRPSRQSPEPVRASKCVGAPPSSRSRPAADDLSGLEMAVLTLMPTQLSLCEIGNEMYVSFNAALRSQPRTLTARATTSRIVVRAINDWIAISSLAMALSGIVSVGLNAVAFVYDV
jgi:hypothetical protein